MGLFDCNSMSQIMDAGQDDFLLILKIRLPKDEFEALVMSVDLAVAVVNIRPNLTVNFDTLTQCMNLANWETVKKAARGHEKMAKYMSMALVCWRLSEADDNWCVSTEIYAGSMKKIWLRKLNVT